MATEYIVIQPFYDLRDERYSKPNPAYRAGDKYLGKRDPKRIKELMNFEDPKTGEVYPLIKKLDPTGQDAASAADQASIEAAKAKIADQCGDGDDPGQTPDDADQPGGDGDGQDQQSS